MTVIKLLIELDYDADLMHGDDADSIHWFRAILLRDNELILHSNEIGDAIGSVRVLQELDTPPPLLSAVECLC